MSTDIDRMLGTPSHVTQATAVEQSRAVAEVVAAVTAARQFPRDVAKVREEIKRECASLALAEVAFYSVPQRGEGETVHLARELARIYGHVQYGVHELHRDDAARMSEIRAYAWDPQTGVRQERTFQVPHAHMVGKGAAKKVVYLDDLDDVYRRNQNVGAKAVRECIFGVLPKALVAEARRLCRETLERGEGVRIEDRRSQVVAWFADQFGVSREQLEKRIGMPVDRWTPQHVASLGVVGRSLKAGETTLEEEFPGLRVSADDLAPSAPSAPTAPAASEPPIGRPIDDHQLPGDDYDPTTEPGFGQDGGDQ